VEVLAKINLPKPIAVVAPNKTNNENAVWFKNLTALEISKLMEKADFGIFPASTVAIEACAKRLPFICGYFVDNQKEFYHGIKANDLALCVGNYKQITKKEFSEAINNFTSNEASELLKEKQRNFIDKKSHKRIVNEFRKL
jgi:spore coat polysaccharide biosynthesis predicted glycosyltransferase SpsG